MRCGQIAEVKRSWMECLLSWSTWDAWGDWDMGHAECRPRRELLVQTHMGTRPDTVRTVQHRHHPNAAFCNTWTTWNAAFRIQNARLTSFLPSVVHRAREPAKP